ncbi:ATPase family protein [Dictyocaulus viviparus]|uniref:Midasin n=1 Tax=Dictyocaulus viviparus TaxID=29172 RepID=A0A0D8YAX2_DICVI|nr:ATPase family protein [Dictyocaulus viviparus]
MVTKKGKRLKSLKRPLSEFHENSSDIHIPVQRRKLNDADENFHLDQENSEKNRTEIIEEDWTILPTREFLAYELIVALRSKQLVIVEGPVGCGKTFIASYANWTILPTREFLAHELIVALRSKQLVIVEGPIGCGKTFIASYASKRLNLPLKVMQMGDQIDSVNLFGAYHCTEVAGEFLWRPSNFNQDIDMSNADVITSVVEVACARSKTLPCGAEITLHEGVCIVSTISGRGNKNSILDSIPLRITLKEFTDEELRRLITQTYPRISHLSKLLISIFRSVESLTTFLDSRLLTSTDLLRGCSRINSLPDITSNMAIFTELVDVWCFASPSEKVSELCLKVAAALSITADQVSFHLSLRAPSFSNTVYVIPGIVFLFKIHGMSRFNKIILSDVLQLLERLAVCVQNREPVLLVGETGIGKTYVVQSLATILNVTLKVVNLCPSSDAAELISGSAFAYFLIATAEKALSKKSNKKDPRWATIIVRAKRIRSGLDRGATPFIMDRGAVLEAAQDGHWLLIDEINLAPPECLDAIVDAISKDVHPNFRLFACMNPCTDVGRRRIPASVRTRFTEFYVSDTKDFQQLALIVSAYMPSMKPTLVTNLVNFYLQAKQLYPSNYNLRTLCRVLQFAGQNMFINEDQSLYEAVTMAFLTNLDTEDKEKMRGKIAHAFHVGRRIPMNLPKGGNEQYILVEGYRIERGTELPRPDENYIITKTVKENLTEIARITCSGRFPVLLEGETCTGKTSIVCHLARITGNSITRINNHEYTDIQESVTFRRLPLAVVLVQFDYIVGISALMLVIHKLLDDNQELFIPESNSVVHAHPRFRLFATQNPAGYYGGRKHLSRALMSRFVVLRFNHLPLDELSLMVCARCGVHMSAATKMIEVLCKLRLKRSLSGIFSAMDSLMTLRDVFRWAKRLITDSSCDDWLQILVNHGYFLLAGRCRSKRDIDSVVETLQNELGRKIEPDKLFAINSPYMPKNLNTSGMVMTMSMRRMLVMTEQAWLRHEAVLIVGETGGGKTSLAQAIGGENLMTINCHERTDTADLLGRLRPRKNGGFAWSDGIVVSAMKTGVPLLIDEISLAEDSVLERLNPLFEEERTLLLSDAGVDDYYITAQDGFEIIATMNPGGDYGKKELSKALRNRFTEIWSSCDYEEYELVEIFESKLNSSVERTFGNVNESVARIVVIWMVKFFKKYFNIFRHSPCVRDVVACAEVYSACVSNGFSRKTAIWEAIRTVFLDGLNVLKMRMMADISEIRKDAEDMFHRLSSDVVTLPMPSEVLVESKCVTIGALSILFGSHDKMIPKEFCLRAPTCVANFYRIAKINQRFLIVNVLFSSCRALLINKPILLEGAPGCGKSSTVMAIATLTGHAITRLNLSEQTDLSDLFGSDVPVVTDNGQISFKWIDGPVLAAIKRGEWVLFDEMNLASQAVLEGLNACFDHRRVIYIAELNRSFEIPSGSHCRFFACQNPHAYGGNRRALPKSFVNRFTSRRQSMYFKGVTIIVGLFKTYCYILEPKVQQRCRIEKILLYLIAFFFQINIEELTSDDILFVLNELPAAVQIGHGRLVKMISIIFELANRHDLIGGPFSFNLRDLLRWVQLFEKYNDMHLCFQVLIINRLRSEKDREKAKGMYENIFGEPCILPPLHLSVDDEQVRLGQVSLPRFKSRCDYSDYSCRLLSSQFTLMHQLAVCVDMQWMTLIVGARNSGKRSTLQNLANICGVHLQTIVVNSETDAQELIGSYEQTVDDSVISDVKSALCKLLNAHVNERDLKQILNAENVTQLQALVEMALSDIKDNESLVNECHSALERAVRSTLRFEWVDSPFVRAYLNGYWLLIEDVNLCSAAVLDRLNSCFERDGHLVVFERHSSFEPLKPHPNFRPVVTLPFRAFLSMDARNGEVSHAMRNRSVEIFVAPEMQWNSNPVDVAAVTFKHGNNIPAKIVESLRSLSAEKLLHFSVLLSEMSLESACRAIGLHNLDDADDSAATIEIPPLVKDIGTERYPFITEGLRFLYFARVRHVSVLICGCSTRGKIVVILIIHSVYSSLFCLLRLEFLEAIVYNKFLVIQVGHCCQG